MQNIKDLEVLKTSMINQLEGKTEEELKVLTTLFDNFNLLEKGKDEEVEEIIKDLDVKEMEILMNFLGQIKEEYSRIEEIKNYEASFEFYGETEEVYHSRIREIMNRLEGDEIEKNLTGYLCSILEITDNSNPKNPIIMESSVVEDLLEPIITNMSINEGNRDLIKLESLLKDSIYNFFNSDFLYSPFKTDKDGEEFRLVTPTPEIYTLMGELPNPLIKILKILVLQDEGEVEKIEIIPFDGETPTRFKLKINFEDKDLKENILLQEFYISVDDMAKLYLKSLNDFEEAEKYYHYIIDSCVVENMERYISKLL